MIRCIACRATLACVLIFTAALPRAVRRSGIGGRRRTTPGLSHRYRRRQDREPISKYIYGQFIEHLGRCIYGGIWAEMLEDRKFFDPVGRKESPWKAGRAGRRRDDGRASAVRRRTHAPKIALRRRRHARRHRPGRLGAAQGQAVRRPRSGWPASPQAGPVRRQPGLGRRARSNGQTIAIAELDRRRIAKTPLRLHRRRRHRRRPPGDHAPRAQAASASARSR